MGLIPRVIIGAAAEKGNAVGCPADNHPDAPFNLSLMSDALTCFAE